MNDNPTDDDHPGHAEAVEVIFDPERTSYRKILEFFFQIQVSRAGTFWEAGLEDQNYLQHYPDGNNQFCP